MKQVREFAGARINPPPTYPKPPIPPAPPQQVVRVGDIVDVYFAGERLHAVVIVVKVQDGHVECAPLPTIDPSLLPTKETTHAQ